MLGGTNPNISPFTVLWIVTLLAAAMHCFRMFYGPGGPYALFAGKDASRALAKMSFEDKDLTGDISGLGPFELEALQDWEYKFMSKYEKVGTIKAKDAPVADGSSPSETIEATNREAPNHAEGSPLEKPEDGPTEKPAAEAVETYATEAEKEE